MTQPTTTSRAPGVITARHLSRRTVLRGVGVTVALPFLDAFVPAGSRFGRVAAALDPTRLVCIEMVHGAAGSTAYGAAQHLWSPARVGRDFDLTSSALKPLEPLKDYLTIATGTDVRPAEAVQPKEIGGDHFRSSATFLTQSHPRQTESSDVFAGTFDPTLALTESASPDRTDERRSDPATQLCIENVDQAGGCAYGYSCVYTDTISWASPEQPLPMIRDPRFAFDQLFGDGGTPAERAARRRSRTSVLDFIVAEVADLRRELGPHDRQRMAQYLDDIREIVHNHKRCPLFVLGGANGKLPGRHHLRAEPGTPMANVMLSLLHCLGLDDLNQFGDSTAAFSLSA